MKPEETPDSGPESADEALTSVEIDLGDVLNVIAPHLSTTQKVGKLRADSRAMLADPTLEGVLTPAEIVHDNAVSESQINDPSRLFGTAMEEVEIMHIIGRMVRAGLRQRLHDIVIPESQSSRARKRIADTIAEQALKTLRKKAIRMPTERAVEFMKKVSGTLLRENSI
jgi:hypothetical protein